MFDLIGSVPLYLWIVIGASIVGIATGLIYDSDGTLALSLLFGLIALPITILVAIFSFATVVSYGTMAIVIATAVFFVWVILWVIVTSLIDLASY